MMEDNIIAVGGQLKPSNTMEILDPEVTLNFMATLNTSKKFIFR